MTAPSIDTLRAEIFSLFQYVQRLREEIASISRRQGDQTAFENMSDQLSAIVSSTEEATHSILQAIEEVQASVAALHEAADADERGALCDRISANAVKIMEACTFQDITGQRVAKIVGSLRFVEEHVNNLAELWGRDEIETLGAAQGRAAKQAEETGDEAGLLDGPQLPGQAITQDEIDKLFS